MRAGCGASTSTAPAIEPLVAVDDASASAGRRPGGGPGRPPGRGHLLTVDQPVGDGGTDTGPTPTELLVASLAACVAHYARRYLADIVVGAAQAVADERGRPARELADRPAPDRLSAPVPP